MPTLDVSKTYEIIVNTEPVEFIRKQDDGTYATPLPIPIAKRRAAAKTDYVQNPIIIGQKVAVFHLWKDHLGDVVPHQSDKLTAKLERTSGPETWVVVEVGVHSFEQRFRLLCRWVSG